MGLLAGSVTTVIGGLVASIPSGLAMVAGGLFLVGVGWSAALGRIDLLAAMASSVGGLAGGVVLDLGGSTVHGVGVSVPFVLVAGARATAHRSRPRPLGARAGHALSPAPISRARSP